jgi:AraC-like DNA-binding protein
MSTFCTVIRFLLFILSISLVQAQVRLEVSVDSLKLPDEPLYMASSLNDWNPKDPQWKLRRISRTTYIIDVAEQDFEYKFTQGNWNIVEGTGKGTVLPNRLFTETPTVDGVKKVRIQGWEHRPEFEITITKIPENTPPDASIYVSGNFNNWEVKDELFRMKKQYDGSYKIHIFSKQSDLEFKFHRGSWNSAESWKSGKARPNRIVNAKADPEIISAEIENWEDLSSTFNFFSLFDLILLFAAFQSLLLMIVIPTMQDFNREANLLLVILLGLASFFLFCKVVAYYRDVANWFPKLILLPNFALFTYAPLFYFYIQKLLFKKTFSRAQAWPHFVLPALLLLAYIPFFFMEDKRFQHKIVNNEADLMTVFAITFVIAVFSNAYYYLKSKKAITKYSESYINETAYHQNINYLSTVLVLFSICIVLGIFTCLLFAYDLVSKDISPLLENSINLIWIAFSLIGFVLGYYAIHQPEIFKIIEETERTEVVKAKPAIPEQDLDGFKARMEEIMLKDKPFLNPNLTLNDLAILLKTPSHTLSKVIREGYQKNFFDFINSYRIEEFKEYVNQAKYQNYTLLGIAFEVGFNSKTAFNRSFKKMTGQTPSEYYQSRK